MPVHDWTKVEEDIFHNFNHCWITENIRVLNHDLLPDAFYALVEQLTTGFASDATKYLDKVKEVTIRHVSDHSVVAIIEIVPPGNKANRRDFLTFVEKTQKMLRQGIHLLVIDLFPPGKRDPQGIHQAIWEGFDETEFELPASKPLVLASYKAGYVRESFVEPFAVGDTLIDMPVFLSDNEYVSLPLEQTYGKAWELVPAYGGM